MSSFRPPSHLAWFDQLLAEVDRAFAVTGARTPGWDDPHPDRRPAEEEYSRCLNPGKYRILQARVDAWVQVLGLRTLATTTETAPEPWVGGLRLPDGIIKVRLIEPEHPGGLTLALASTLVDGEPFGFDVGIARSGMPTAFVDAVPDCGCDACDSGSADLLRTLDGWVLTVTRGGVVHARAESAHITKTIDGWKASGSGFREAWLDESSPVPDSVTRWIGEPWQ